MPTWLIISVLVGVTATVLGRGAELAALACIVMFFTGVVMLIASILRAAKFIAPSKHAAWSPPVEALWGIAGVCIGGMAFGRSVLGDWVMYTLGPVGIIAQLAALALTRRQNAHRNAA